MQTPGKALQPKSVQWAKNTNKCNLGSRNVYLKGSNQLFSRVCVMIEFSYKRGPKKVLHILPPNI